MIQYIDEVKDLKGKRVLVRLDLNVPIQNGIVTDPYRLERSIETVDFLRLVEAKVIIIAHCEGKESTSLLPMWEYLKGYFPVSFCPTYFTPEAIDMVLNMEDKGVILFENLRINEGEKNNDMDFAKKLAQMADIYVNDAFSVSHRKHASIVSVPTLLPHYGGLLLKQEIQNLSKAFTPQRPFAFILGGAKFETKLPLIKKYLDKADSVFIGGALANNVLKEKGYEVGTSLVSTGDFGIKEMLSNPKLFAPIDVTVTNPAGEVFIKKADSVLPDECIVDVGPETIKAWAQVLDTARMIVWNGPLGNFEIGFHDKTEMLAEVVAGTTEKNKTETIVGGGDTLASIKELHLEDKFSFISTGGGAMLDYLVAENLPGIEALQ